MWVVFNGDCFLHMILADVLIHLINSEGLSFLVKSTRHRQKKLTIIIKNDFEEQNITSIVWGVMRIVH